MNDPCLVNDYVDAAAVRRYGCFKWLVLLLLLALLPLLLLIRGFYGEDTVTASVSEAPAVAIATEVPEVIVAPLTLEPPRPGEFALAAEAGGQVEGTFRLAGAGEPGAHIQIWQQDRRIGDTTVDSQGNWTFDGELISVPGRYDLQARMIDTDGTLLDEANEKIVVPDVVGLEPEIAELGMNPPRPGELAFTAGAGDQLTGALNLTGSGEPGTDIQIRQGDNLIGQAAVRQDGSWSFDGDVSLAPGRYIFKARMVDTAGALLSESDTFEIVIPELEAPEAPTLSIGGGKTSRDEILIGGTAAPSAEVEILVNGDLKDTVMADANGTWSYSTRLPAAEYEVLARTASGTEDGVELESEPQTITVGFAGPVILGTNKGDNGSETLPGFYGEGRPNSVLEILEAEVPVGTVTVRADGSWSCSCTLAPGEHTLAIREVGDPGSVSQPITLVVASPAPPYEVPNVSPDPNRPKFTCPDGPPPPGEIRGNLYVVARCETMGLIAGRVGASLEDLMAHNPQVPDPGRIYAGQLLNIPTNAACIDSSN